MPLLPTLSLLLAMLAYGVLFRLYAWRTTLSVSTLGLMFAPPLAVAPFVLFLWLTVTKMAVRGFASVFNLPYFALGAEMADGFVERSSIVAYRTIAGIFTGVLITALAYSVFFAGEGGL